MITDYLQVKTEGKILKAAPKGFWSDTITAKYGDELLTTFKNGVDSFGGSPFVVLADMSKFKQPTENGKNIIGQMMEHAAKNGMHKAVEILERNMMKVALDATAKDKIEEGGRIIVGSYDEGLDKANAIVKEM